MTDTQPSSNAIATQLRENAIILLNVGGAPLPGAALAGSLQMAADEIELLEQRLKVAQDCLHKVLSTAHEPSDEYESIGWQYKHHSSWGGFVWSDSAESCNGSAPVDSREIFAKRSTPTKCEGT